MTKAWLHVLGDHHIADVFASYEYFLGQGDTFPPTLGQIAARAKIERFPLLGLNPIEHQMQGSVFFKQYCRKYGSPPSYNARGDVNAQQAWQDRYAKRISQAIKDMLAVSNERIEKYINRIIDDLDNMTLPEPEPTEPDKPLSPAAIARFREQNPKLFEMIEKGPQEPTEETKERWKQNLNNYSSKVMRRQDGLNPTQRYSIETVMSDGKIVEMIYVGKRTKHLRGEKAIETKTGLTRTYLD